MTLQLPELPFNKDALEPHMSAETFDYHHGKHHQAYVDKTNALIEGSELANESIEKIIAQARADNDQALFNQSAQVWNHSFFWHCLSPNASHPTASLANAIDRKFGGKEKFFEAFTEAATSNFGSGWTWLVLAEGELEIASTDDAGTPIVDSRQIPLLTLDVWEHAYYLDHRNDRGAFVEAFLTYLADWDFARRNYEDARERHAA